MIDNYELLYLTENLLRQLVRNVLSQGEDWWKECVPSDVKGSVEDEMKKKKYEGANRKDELEYTHLGQLKKIIVWRKNWNKFKPYLSEKNPVKFGGKIDSAIPMRNAIGHCIPLSSGDDQKFAEIRFKDIIGMVKT